jgi:exodeoxyribonuclease V gamma subunit
VLLRARGWLPQGMAGELAARAARAEALPLWAASQPWREAQRLPDCTVAFAAAGWQLSARLDGLGDQGLWRVRHGRLRARDRLRLWLDHLLLNIAAPPGVPRVSTLVARDELLSLPAEPAAAEILADLLALYREGAARVLPFYPETAWAWQAQRNWRREWEGDRFNGKPGERDDPYIRLALRDSADAPLGAEFQLLSRRVFAPLQGKLGDG